MLSKNIAKLLLNSGAVALNPTKPFTYASGIKSPIYCDNRSLISLTHERKEVVQGFVELTKIHKLSFDVVAGTATAGIPWAAWLAAELDKPMVYVRGAAKEHGKGNQIEGQIKSGQKVLLIEDLISTGGSSVAVVEALKLVPVQVVACLAIFTYQMKAAIGAFEKAGVTVHTLSDFATLIQVASDQGTITAQQKEIVLEWNEDPQNWGVRHGFA